MLSIAYLALDQRMVAFFSTLGLPGLLVEGLWLLVPILAVVVTSTLGVLVLVWQERKISAAVQQRIGPEYAGPLGMMQSLTDGLKLLFKEDIIPFKGDRFLFTIGPGIVLVPVLISYLIIPFGPQLIVSDISLGILFWIAVSSIAPMGLLIAGYGSNNKYAFLGGLRAAAQAISYELPLALSVLSICLMSHSLSTLAIVEQQSQWGLLGWNIWRQPIGFTIFFLSSLAECERLPFDLPEAEEELVAGYQTEYSGIKFGLFYVASYLNLFVSSLFMTLLYLGGWGPGWEILDSSMLLGKSNALWILANWIGLLLTLSKTYIFLFLSILTRWTLPRVRIDQLLHLGWKFLLPIALGNLLITASLQLNSG